jgi:hypothetical protein
VYVDGMAEDPNDGAHEDFVETILDAADDLKVFPAGTPSAGVVAYLNDFA